MALLFTQANKSLGGSCPPPRESRSLAKMTPQQTNLSSSPSSPPTKRQKTSSSPTLPRSQRVANLARQRDNFRCVLTGAGDIDIAHIYPHHSMKYKEGRLEPRYNFWNHLKLFWPKEKIAAWEAEMFPNSIGEFGVERVYNLICLSSSTHRIWAEGQFALKPISVSDDEKTLTIQFFWQEKHRDLQPAMSFLTRAISTEGINEITISGGGVSRLRNKDNVQVTSGDYFQIQTDDPAKKPLPSFKLLELQWFIHRVIGMAGAADVYWPSLSESGSDIDEIEGEYMLEDMFEDEVKEYNSKRIPGLTPDIVVSGSSENDPTSPPTALPRDRLNIPDRSKHLEEGEGNTEQSQMDVL